MPVENTEARGYYKQGHYFINSLLIISSYPLYRRGNPQLRIFLPNFWMKLLNNEKNYIKSPPNCVTFEVSPAMTSLDVRNYLEKIYKVHKRTLN